MGKVNNVDELRKRYGDRRAFEWFMRAEDQRYWNMTQKLVKEERKQMMATLKKRGIAIAVFAIIFHLIVANHIHLLLVRNQKRL